MLDDVLDVLLDQEDLEVDPIDRLDADTPLHKAVRFINEQSKTDWENVSSLVELLLDAGADPRFVTSSLLAMSFDVSGLFERSQRPKSRARFKEYKDRGRAKLT